MAIKQTAQTGFDTTGKPEQSLDNDGEMTFAVQQFFEATQDYEAVKETVSTFNSAKKRIVELVKDKGLTNGLYRVGEHVIEVRDRNGGGFDIPAWESKGVSIKSSGVVGE